MTSQDNSSGELKTLIRKLYKEIAFWLLSPIVGGSIVLYYGGKLDGMILVGALACWGMAAFGFWTIRKTKKRMHSGDDV